MEIYLDFWQKGTQCSKCLTKETQQAPNTKSRHTHVLPGSTMLCRASPAPPASPMPGALLLLSCRTCCSSHSGVFFSCNSLCVCICDPGAKSEDLEVTDAINYSNYEEVGPCWFCMTDQPVWHYRCCSCQQIPKTDSLHPPISTGQGEKST